jgi:CDP-glycerol glycerophosphotransferase (TagB/SpsB family)
MLENLKDIEVIKANNSLGGKKIILYAPTGDRNNNAYRKSEFSVSNIEFYKYVVNSLLQSNIVLIVKTHLNDSISKDVRNFVKANENILFQDNLKLTNDYDSMVISDVLITDYSTIYVDYLLLEKPIYIISNPDPDPDRVQSSIFKDIKLPKLKNKKDIESMFIKLKDDKLESYNITNLKNNIYENLSHLKTIEKINERLSSDPK